MDADVLIIGGGVAGLSLANTLSSEGRDFRLVEARPRLGGRIWSVDAKPPLRDTRFDLGPTWFWPGHQRVAALAERFGLRVFPQHSIGRTVLEERDGRVRRDLEVALNSDGLRIEGGMAQLVDALARDTPGERLVLDAEVTAIERMADRWRATIARKPQAIEINARNVVLAAPPRVVAARIRFDGGLSTAQLGALEKIPTWMAGHAKALLIYDEPFWRTSGFSGDAISQRGPLAQIHDASPADGAVGALFGFIGYGAHERRSVGEDALRARILRQAGALFGVRASEPAELMIADWSLDPRTATPADLPAMAEYPTYGVLPSLLKAEEDGLFFAVTELAPVEGGFVEGALAAAERVAEALRTRAR